MDASEALHTFFDLHNVMTGQFESAVPDIGLKPNSVIIDLRQPHDFDKSHLPGSINVPFIQEDTASPFSEPRILEALWTRFEETFRSPSEELQALIQGKNILLLCYDGDSSRVATSVLRAKGFEASNVRGGFTSWAGRERSESPVVYGQGSAGVALSDPIIVAAQEG